MVGRKRINNNRLQKASSSKKKLSSSSNDSNSNNSGLLRNLAIGFLVVFFIHKTIQQLHHVPPLYSLTKTSQNLLQQQQQQQSSSSAADVSSSSSSSSSLAYQHSFGLFDDISNEMWEHIRKNIKTKSMYWNPTNPLYKVDDTEFWNMHNPRPILTCPHGTTNLGKINDDGVKYVCYPERLTRTDEQRIKASDGDSSTPSCLIYSFGCAGNYVFEDAVFDMHGKSCEIHVFDPATRFARANDPTTKNIHYHPWGLLSTYDKENKSKVWPAGYGGTYKTFPEILKELGHDNENTVIDILKIDCEGCEWSTYKDWITIGARQILVEMHGVPTPVGIPTTELTKKFFQKERFRCFRIL